MKRFWATLGCSVLLVSLASGAAVKRKRRPATKAPAISAAAKAKATEQVNDALAVGFSLSLIGVFVWYPAIVIGVVTGLVSWFGLRLGGKLGEKFGKRMEIVGGAVLIVIGGTLWFYHLQASLGWHWAWNIPVTIVAIVLVGAGQHQLTGLAHEASHHILFKNRYWNDLASDLLCMFPLYSSTHHYRLQHIAHHQFVNDPERDGPELIEPALRLARTAGRGRR